MNVQVSTRISEDVKSKVLSVLDRYGLDLPSYLKMVTTVTATRGDIPFQVGTPEVEESATQDFDVSKYLSKLPQHKITVGKDGNLVISDDFPEELLDAWEM
ncbi:MAG: type II toxin-antitoxin system RelB/DinJ family antitoxin [Bifidobacteriaceae bacterium]|jgi:addiction module RelB/DinJ family antitoxin|nr:type II toxin-antitoxin system RelB/DinJ family antitoxin [Bifidobacteriaceae bacterium]